MQWIAKAVAGLVLFIGCAALVWNSKNQFQWQPQTFQFSSLTAQQDVIQQLSTLPAEIEKEASAHAPINIMDFGGWPEKHTAIGTMTIPDANISCNVIFGDNNSDLNKGGCFYADRQDRIPGGGLQMLMASHNNSYFHTLGDVKEGSKVLLDLYYGEYEYEVVRTEVVRATDTTTYDLNSTEEELIVYTCYPFDQLSATPYRFFVYCKPVYSRPLQK